MRPFQYRSCETRSLTTRFVTPGARPAFKTTVPEALRYWFLNPCCADISVMARLSSLAPVVNAILSAV
ncbi:Uncharacterised protein [Mycobacteroides abscessus subsp. abscessus]|nr:Uncharacterised protein [Mycobacteroides abscessus subsp. abscessus]